MVLIPHGFVDPEAGPPFPMRSRYVALLDVLAMKEWITTHDAGSVAGQMRGAVVKVADQLATLREPTRPSSVVGEILGLSIFSDSVIVYTPDDSWDSLSLLILAVKQLVSAALENGIPVRGAISRGPCVMHKEERLYVGKPIVDAHLSDRVVPNRGIGVHLTEALTRELKAEAIEKPISEELTNLSLFTASRGKVAEESLVYYGRWSSGEPVVMVAHWSPTIMILQGQLREGWHLRNLADTEESREKLEQSYAFLEHCARRYDRRCQAMVLPTGLKPEEVKASWRNAMLNRHERLAALVAKGLHDEPPPPQASGS